MLIRNVDIFLWLHVLITTLHISYVFMQYTGAHSGMEQSQRQFDNKNSLLPCCLICDDVDDDTEYTQIYLR